MTDRFDILVVGAGPAGLAAAHAAAARGAHVGLLDAQPRPGGQVWRHDTGHLLPRQARRALTQIEGRVTWLPQHQIVAGDAHLLLAETPTGSVELSFDALVLATGARELFMPFPGWTLPGVTGAGGLQALTKQGWPIRDKRVIVAGSGPLLLAAANTLRKHDAHVLGIYEQAPTAAVMAFARQLWRWPARAAQALMLRTELAGVPYRFGAYVSAAHGGDVLSGVDITDTRGTIHIDCDYAAVGYGLVPNIELAEMLGCMLDKHATHPQVQVDDLLHTSLAGVYAVGEACGVAGLDSARIDGRMAGLVAAGDVQAAAALLPARAKARRFADLLTRHFALDSRVRGLAAEDTIICRCEDVPCSALTGFTDARAAKLATRCGMGACQGRICGTALAELGRFPRGSSRPPIFPARLSTLAPANPAWPSPANFVSTSH